MTTWNRVGVYEWGNFVKLWLDDGWVLQVYLNLGDKELDYNSNFRLYITTKLGNPRFAPEIATKTTIINFSVKEDSLEKQLLTLVVQKERPDLDKQRNELIITVSGTLNPKPKIPLHHNFASFSS